MAWSHGYNVSSGYTHGFYRELAPHWLNFGALLHGYRVPELTGGFRYLELGTGQGFGLCALAAVYPQGEFIGVDFNPEHIAHARGLAEAAGLTNIRFEEADFSVLAEDWPADFGAFDYAVMHGIYSWVPEPIRAALVALLNRALQPGGLVYVSYNTLPGWTSAIPLQHMLRRLQVASSVSGEQIIQQGAALFDNLVQAGAGVAQAMPPLKARLDSLKTQSSAYLVQEYLHENWHPLWFSQVHDELAAAKLSYVGSATLPENYLPGLLAKEQAEVVNGAEGYVMRQELIDLMQNQSFRRDLYCRGPRLQRRSMAQLGAFSVVAGRPLDETEVCRISTSFGHLTIDFTLAQAIYAAVLDQPRTLDHVASLAPMTEKPVHELIQVVTMLLHAGYLALAHSAAARVEALNDVVSQQVIDEFVPYTCLVGAHTPTALGASDTDMAFYRIVRQAPLQNSKQLAAALVDSLRASGRNLVKSGKVLSVPDEAFEHAQTLSEKFLGQTLPLWQRLGVMPPP